MNATEPILELLAFAAPSGRSPDAARHAGDRILSHAGELDFAVERFIRDAKQRAKGHPEAEAIGGDRRQLHIKRDCA